MTSTALGSPAGATAPSDPQGRAAPGAHVRERPQGATGPAPSGWASARRSVVVAARRVDDVLHRRRLWVVAAVQLLCALAVLTVSRLWLADQSLRLDESQSMQQTDRSYGAMLKEVAQDVHVPGHHLLLRTWRLAFGGDVETARALSLVFFLASLPVLYLVARRVLRTRWALLAVALFALSPFMNWYGNEARMYTMLVFATLLSQLFLLRVLRRGSAGDWTGFALTAVAGAYTHYFFLFVLVAQGLVFLLVSSRERWRGLGRMAGTAVLVALALLPWLAYFRAEGSASGTRPQLPSPSSVDFTNVYSQFLGGFLPDSANSALVATWPLLMLAALLVVRVARRPDRELWAVVAAAFGPVLLAFVLSHLISPFFLSRYMIAALPAVVLLVVAFVAAMRPRFAVVSAAVVLALTATATVAEAVRTDVPVKEDYRGAAELLSEKAGPSDLVVVSSPFTIWPFEKYYDGDAKVVTLPEWDRRGGIPAFDPAALPDQVDALASGHQRVYLLLSYDQGYEADIADFFQRNYAKVYEEDLTPGMEVVGYRVGYDQLEPVGGLQLTQPLTQVVGPAVVRGGRG
ncbi:glycosyltransferase family 39 protein [Quadrisphaera sp. KR29]|uniref:glycosyltransferase family 39 protein n=1 Tax=Quadrisphaera sp. KR29 TaxID=3461391 RepID=UPI0040444955